LSLTGSSFAKGVPDNSDQGPVAGLAQRPLWPQNGFVTGRPDCGRESVRRRSSTSTFASGRRTIRRWSRSWSPMGRWSCGTVVGSGHVVTMADPEGNEFCLAW